MKHFRKFIPITKVDVAQRLVYGLATCEKKDRAGETCHYETTVPYYKAWSREIAKATGDKSFGNVRSMHSKVAAGKLNEQIVFNDDLKQVEICAKIVDDAEWKKVEEGVYSGFSQGGSYVKTWKDGDINYYTADPMEVSLVDLPCLPESTFSVIKSDGTVALRKFVPVVVEPSITDLGMRAEQLAKDAGKPVGDWQSFVEKARSVIFDEQIEKAAAQAYPPGDDAKTTDDDKKTKGGTDHNIPDKDIKDKKKSKKFVEPTGPFWRCNCADHQHVNKVDAVDCLKKDAATESATAITAPLADAIGKLRELLAPIDDPMAKLTAFVAEKFKGKDLIDADIIVKSAKDAADALMQLMKKFPDHPAMIDKKSVVLENDVNEVKLDELVKAFNAEPTRLLARSIVKTAKAEKVTLDDTAKSALAELLSKGLYDVCRLADLIASLKWLVDSTTFEAQIEGDGSTVGADLKTAAISLCACLVAMVQEETAELFEPDDDDVTVLAMAAGSLSPASVDTLAKSGAKIEYIETLQKNASITGTVTGVLELIKTEYIEKKGARHSKADQENIQQMHDLSVQLGGDCTADDADKAAGGDLSKDAENVALRKQVGDLLPLVTALVEDVSKLKAQPMPAKAAARQVGKVEDGGASDEVSQLAAAFDKLSPEDRAHEVMKLSLRHPIPGAPAHQGR